VRPVPVRKTEPPVDKLVPILEVDREQQHAATVKPGVRPPWGQTPSTAATTRLLPDSLAR
jgi:hypothetical protein